MTSRTFTQTSSFPASFVRKYTASTGNVPEEFYHRVRFFFCVVYLFEHEKNILISYSNAHLKLGIAELRKKMHHTLYHPQGHEAKRIMARSLESVQLVGQSHPARSLMAEEVLDRRLLQPLAFQSG